MPQETDNTLLLCALLFALVYSLTRGVVDVLRGKDREGQKKWTGTGNNICFTDLWA